ncbi:CheR family methyltransferase [Clostridioides difficile]|nr:CheR family methyltransferase [Clostridioides difficile]EQE15710.1 cheR methyltransferase, SAM binding domain protein [Clostridioides difficile CD3]MDL0148024.1 CheR family methyltransferase [Clostridioides difficile]MDL0401350.1 CheR family methyltransferase [Clostridioides difficile]
MIYFDLKTREELINKFYNATKKDSFLFVGHAEVINRSSTKYKYVKPAIYKR